jgi:hypothetical protein
MQAKRVVTQGGEFGVVCGDERGDAVFMAKAYE